MVRIRLTRIGRKKVPFYRIIVIDIRKKRNGEPIAFLGTYNPISKDVKLDEEKALFYIKNGAQPTKVVENILRKKGLLENNIKQI